jgi:glycosyltransferase involved in cell wall biosynthesis
MSEKLNILFVVQSLVKGGAERLVLDIATALTAGNMADVLIVAFDERNDYPSQSAGIERRVCRITYHLSVLGKNRMDLSEFNAVVHEFRPDVIHTHCYFQEAPAREIPYPNAVYFTHIHDNMPVFASAGFRSCFTKKGIIAYYEKKRLITRYRRAENHFIAISNDCYSYFSAGLPPDLRKRLFLLPNAINYSRFYVDEARQIVMGSTVRLINIGHSAPKKNQVFLVAVVKILREKGFHVRLELVGDLQHAEAQIGQEMQKHGLENEVVFSGLIENVEDHLRQSDIYVHSATYEPFGLVLLEAMASGLPVVCLDGKGNRDIIVEGKNGFMVGTPDPEAFAERIIKLISRPDLYAEMSAFAKEFASDYDMTHYAGKLMGLYRSALENRKMPHGQK